MEGIAGGPVGAGLEGTAGGPVGAEETRLGTTSGSAATTVAAATDSKSTGALAAAVVSLFFQAGVLTSFAGCFRFVESGSETGSVVPDVCHGGVRGESSCSDSIPAASPTLILVAPPSAFSP